MKKALHLPLGILAFACTAAFAVAGAAAPLVESLRTSSGPEFDRRYLEAMREHHQLGAELAKIAGERGQNQELSSYATKAAISHELDVREINKLLERASTETNDGEGPRAQIGSLPTAPADAATPEIEGPTVTGAELKRRLESAQGAEFDRVFVEVMTQHEKISLAAAKLAQERATRDDVRMFGAQSVQLRTMQLDQLQNLLNPQNAAEGQEMGETQSPDTAQPEETAPDAGATEPMETED